MAFWCSSTECRDLGILGLALQVLELQVSTLLLFRAALEQPNARGEMLNLIVLTVHTMHTVHAVHTAHTYCANHHAKKYAIMQHYNTLRFQYLPTSCDCSPWIYIYFMSIFAYTILLICSRCPAALSFQCMDQTWSNIIEPLRYLAAHRAIHIHSLSFIFIYHIQ